MIVKWVKNTTWLLRPLVFDLISSTRAHLYFNQIGDIVDKVHTKSKDLFMVLICFLQEVQVSCLNQRLFFFAGCLLLPACCLLFPFKHPPIPLLSSCSKPLWNDLGKTVKFINYQPSIDTMAIWFNFTVKKMKEEKRKKKTGQGEDRKRTHTAHMQMHEWCSSNDNIAVINLREKKNIH